MPDDDAARQNKRTTTLTANHRARRRSEQIKPAPPAERMIADAAAAQAKEYQRDGETDRRQDEDEKN